MSTTTPKSPPKTSAAAVTAGRDIAALSGCSKETPTVQGSDDDADYGIGLSQNSAASSTANKEPAKPLSLKERFPSPAHITAEVAKLGDVNFLVQRSKYNSEEGRAVLFDDDLWQRVNDEVHNALDYCAATCDKDITKMTKMYREKTNHIINEFATRLHQHFPTPHQLQESEQIMDTSLLLQFISMHYIEILHKHISYPSKGDNYTITERVKMKVEHAKTGGINQLYPEPGVKKHVYYITGFLGNQADKEAKRRAKHSGVRACLSFIADNKFLVNNRGDDIQRLIADDDIPTELVQEREAFGGLHYPDKECWEFFATVEYIYAELATPDNFISIGGRLLSEICDAILNNNDLRVRFSALCGYKEDATFTLDDTGLAFAYFLRVFGRVRAKDLTLKYNSGLYKGKNQVALRAELAAKCGGGSKKKSKKKQQPNKKQKTQKDGETEQPEIENDTNDRMTTRATHQAMLDDLQKMNDNIDEDSGTTICSEVVEEMIENDKSE